jgi:predicted RNase H-like HicB family nuclease/DNA-binding XRE family transcriptional regulator
MHYAAYVSRKSNRVQAEFPDCPGCVTAADSVDALAAVAREALEAWLEARLVDGKVPPRPQPRSHAPDGQSLALIPVRPGLSAALMIRWARRDRGLTQSDLARLTGVTQQQINKLEDPDVNSTLETLAKVAKALGLVVSLALEEEARISVPPASNESDAQPRERARDWQHPGP